ncbi:VanZ family protein [Ottowia thiooxydans]|uniref:VanZ family protein n=1 Tax=Ottowia thiooxydans TaxID=219182 RepID=UPI000403A67A|nr:VanZ family protein [Ottowia thiooxydans]
MNRYKSAARPLSFLYAALIVYASLYPFSGWRDQGLSPWAFTAAPLPQYWTRFDIIANVVGYVPMGFLLTLALLRAQWRWPAVVLGALVTALLSFTMESLQSYLPIRVASNLDFGLNTGGGVIGALAAYVLERLGAIERWRRFRALWFVQDSRGALILLALWPLGLLFPPPVAFGLGQVYERLEDALAQLLEDTPFLEWLPLRELDLQPLLPGVELICVALGALVPCLLGYTVIRDIGRRALFALTVLMLGVLVSALSAALTWGPVYAWAWISLPVEAGMMVGAFMAFVALFIPARVCGVLLMLALAAQVALLNAAPESAYFAATLQSWEQGRFIHFHGLAQWVGWLWPYVTFAYLVFQTARLNRHQPSLPEPAAGAALSDLEALPGDSQSNSSPERP